VYYVASINKKKRQAIATTLLFALIFFYFSYHVISGHNGLLTMMQLNKQLEKSQVQLQTTEMTKLDIEHRVNVMSDTVDMDLLDEQARRLLNYSKKGEVIYLIPKEDQKAYYSNEGS
jgi:cell division protein FtsB